MKKTTIRGACAILVLAVAACGGGGAWGQTKPSEPVVVGRASMASIDAFDKLVADLGITRTPEMEFKKGMEESSFLGAGAVATDRPLGVMLVAGDSHPFFPPDRNMVINVPVVAGKATPALQIAAGGAAVAGSNDTFTVKETGLLVRRTADYLHVKNGTDPFGLSVANDTLYAADYKDPTNVFVLVGDLAAMRKAVPDAYKDLAKTIMGLPEILGMALPEDPAPALGQMDKIDKLTLAVGRDDVNFHLKSTLLPSPVKAAAKETARPKFPPGTMLQMHLAYPDVETSAQLEKQLATLPPDTFALGMPPVYHERVKDLVLKLVSLNTRSQAMSVGFTLNAGKPVLYLVDQFRGDEDGIKELGDAVRDGVALAGEGAGVKVTLENSTYAAGDKTVRRLTLTPEAGEADGAAAGGAAPREKLVIDEVQTGRTLFVAISLNADARYVVDLANAGTDGTSSALCFGSLNLGAVVNAALDSKTMAQELVTPLETLKGPWAGKNLTWTVQTAAESGLTTDVTVPMQVVRDLVKLVQASAAPAPTPATDPVQEGLP